MEGMKIKMILPVIAIGAAALATAQVRQPVIVAGGTPLNQANILANGDIKVLFANGAGGEIVVPGRPPNRVFTNDLGEIGIVWSPPIVGPKPVLPPVDAPPVVVPPVVNPPVVAPPDLTPRPPNRLFTNQNGDIGVIWGR